uniref:SCP domain-containing protein n=1 Tax=Peromyscus maniculatus bairdii TaxID=230844 RepID=A0A8C8VT76_PERMB
MSYSNFKQFTNKVLKALNENHAQHGVPPLKLCKKLKQEAQQYSETLASTRILKYSSESSCGQSAWLHPGTGHFTAMVWKNTRKTGVGKASASDGSSFVVARYFPAGNLVNQGFFEENVPPPKK